MKVLAALTGIGLILAIGATDANAQDRTARLDDPATTGPGQERTVIPREGRIETARKSGPARPLGLSDVEINGIREAIRGQLLALGQRDADRAWSYLAPSTKDYFTDPATFMRALSLHMQPLAAPDRYAFSDMDREATDAIQDVVLADLQGREWLARFTMERQPDGSWGIKTCKVEPVSGNRI